MIKKIINTIKHDGLRPFFCLAQANRFAKAYTREAQQQSLKEREQKTQEFLRSADVRDGCVQIPVLNFEMNVNASDAGISRDLIIDGIREKNAVGLVQKFLPKVSGGIYFDVGANLGFYVLIEGTYSGSNLEKIYAFEPLPENAAILRTNVSLNKLDASVVVNECAMSDKPGVSSFQQEGHSNLGHLDDFGSILPEGSHSIDVKVDTIDDFCSREKIEQINFLRMDVEGHEDKVLAGAKHTLSRSEECLIFLELHPRMIKESGRSLPAMLSALEELNFRCVAICGRDTEQIEDFDWGFLKRNVNVLCGCYGYHWFFAKGKL
ncbi:MAG: FkbM family methyltransferase [Akkermansiaceae bacterium]|jgi:FkbM family methyltransferase|nr:FkbM family methyltransferase [Akkermansiaceae bacterium]MDP4721667.1 FkbM family methyltransferase [Akkermansiaceae bacterium]MDP4778839.1 FkbM family methyltransferase [Akkermansiaceae bacterium]MDP4846960.1 FkbM family methyltransferase [Akkermansiaceae bacterium]